MIRRSAQSEDREIASLKARFAEGGEKAIIEDCKAAAARLYREGDIVYKSEAEMAEGFAALALKKING